MLTSEKLKRYAWRIVPAIAIAVTLTVCTNPKSAKNTQYAKSDTRMLNGSAGDSLTMASQDEFEGVTKC